MAPQSGHQRITLSVNPSDVLDGLYAHGFNLGKMQTYSKDFHYVYNYEKNKIYLLDDNDVVIYPEETSKDKLWGFYYDSVDGKLDGVKNYIAMKNITNIENFNQAFSSGTYNIDLNGYFIDLKDDATNYNVTVSNGIHISGEVLKAPSTKEYEKLGNSSITSNGVFEDKVVTGFKASETSGKTLPNDIVFLNCVIYDSSFMIYGNVTFENCTFIGGPNNACVYIDNAVAENSVINIKNCVFDSTVQRAINIAGSKAVKVNIIGCEFNGTSTVKKHIIQVATTKAVVEIKDCDFNALGTSPSIIRFNDNVDNADYTSLVNNITFTNNKIASNISVEDYVDTDDTINTELDDMMTNKMK